MAFIFRGKYDQKNLIRLAEESAPADLSNRQNLQDLRLNFLRMSHINIFTLYVSFDLSQAA